MALSKKIILICVSALLVAAILNSVMSITRVKPAMADFAGLPTIIIDPGHGGEDGGAVSNDKSLVEKNINLAISLTLRDFFVANGFDVIMTRDTDISIHNEGVKGTRKQKVSDLNNRLSLANSSPNAIFLSIHQNKFTNPRSWGTQIFYSPNDPRSEQLASILQEYFINMLQPDNTRQHKKSGKNLYLMYEAKCPATLIECGFLSNSAEAGLLNDTEYQSKVAFTIFCSVMQFLGLEEQPAE